MGLFLQDLFYTLERFFVTGGPVLLLIASAAVLLWALVLERLWYLHGGCQAQGRKVEALWQARNERSSWDAAVTRQSWISESRVLIDHNLSLIKTVIAICPLLGLLGTVTGMIEVFTVLAVSGGGDAKSMAAGVSKATIPTMAGMVVALSGVFVNIYITRTAKAEYQIIEERLMMEH
ncbi:biopolymer transporter ExbB [Gammaproteobacteria bacterium 45_16_T64]|nr:biopolymer transporter ExbB [Gammaproteobacteria bacterium 45_16_T64]